MGSSQRNNLLNELDDETIIDLVIRARSSTHKSNRLEKLLKGFKATVSIGTVLIWLGVATAFYHINNDWTLKKSFFYSVDSGLSIGFGAFPEGEENDDGIVELYSGSILFTTFHALFGGVLITIALGWFVCLIMDKVGTIEQNEAHKADDDTVVKKMAASTKDHSTGRRFSTDDLNEVRRNMQQVARESLMDKVLRFYEKNALSIKIFGTTFLSVFLGAIGIFALRQDISAIESLHFAIGAMATGGFRPPWADKEDDMMFAALFSTIGVPAFALAAGQLAGLLVEREEQKRAEKQFRDDDHHRREGAKLMKEALKGSGGEESLDFTDFMIVSLKRMGRLNDTVYIHTSTGSQQRPVVIWIPTLMQLLGDIRKRFEFLDVDGDATFSRVEMQAMLEFEKYDTKLTGELNVQQFAMVLETLNESFPGSVPTDPPAILAAFRSIDLDSGGTIDKQEYMTWYKERNGIVDEDDDALAIEAGLIDKNKRKQSKAKRKNRKDGKEGRISGNQRKSRSSQNNLKADRLAAKSSRLASVSAALLSNSFIGDTIITNVVGERAVANNDQIQLDRIRAVKKDKKNREGMNTETSGNNKKERKKGKRKSNGARGAEQL